MPRPKTIIVENINFKEFVKFSFFLSLLLSSFSLLLFAFSLLLGLPAYAALFSQYGYFVFLLSFASYFFTTFLSSLVLALSFNIAAKFSGGVKIRIRGGR